MLLSPLLARLFVLHEHGPDRAAQLHVLTVLILCFVPQMVFYGFTTLRARSSTRATGSSRPRSRPS